MAALKVDSQSDAIRQAALEALAKLDTPDGLKNAVALSMPGNDTRTRPTAVATIGKLASQNMELALRTLTALLGDRELRTQRAAGEALVEIKDPRVEEVLRKAAVKVSTDEHKAMYQDWLAKIDAKKSQP